MCLRLLFLRNLKMSEQIPRGYPFIRKYNCVSLLSFNRRKIFGQISGINLFMSIYLCLIQLFLFGTKISGQIPLEKEYPLENIQYFYITDSTGVYVNYSIYSSSDSILLFDDNHQLMRTVIPKDDSILSIINVSKYLINGNDQYELIYVFQKFENGDRHYHTHVIDENSTLIKCFEDQFMWIMSTSEGPKLISQGGVRIYDLPGINYPVSKGEKGVPGAKGLQGLEGPQGLKGEKGDPGILVLKSEFNCPPNPLDMNINESIFLSEPYPNPSQNSSTIDYNISSVDYNLFDYSTSFLVFYDITGLQKLRLMLQSPAGSLEINKSLLGIGAFLFRIETESGFSEIRKLIFE
jgi:hypothetical protein